MDFIKKVWTKQAKSHGSEYTASWSDLFAIELEIETIGRHIKPGHVVLDVGCANGFSTFKQLDRKPKKIVGVDYVPQMIQAANETKKKQFQKENIEFCVGDIRELEFPNDSFDVVYTTRVLINLPNWGEQVKGILECLRILKKDGCLVISEAFWEPLNKLNALRLLCNLPPLVEHDFNRYLKKERLIHFLKEKSLPYQVEPFSSLYYLGSRLVRELVSGLKNPADYKNEINAMFYDLGKNYSSQLDVGIQQAFIITKQ